jgi:hypothetical protein
MDEPNHDGSTGAAHDEEAKHVTETHAQDEAAHSDISNKETNILAAVAAVSVAGVGVAVFSIAPRRCTRRSRNGRAQAFASRWFRLNPVFMTTVRGIYRIGKKTKRRSPRRTNRCRTW